MLLMLALPIHGCSHATAAKQVAANASLSAPDQMWAAPPLPGLGAATGGSGSSYDFADDRVSGDLVRPDGELLAPTPAATAAAAPTPPTDPRLAQRGEESMPDSAPPLARAHAESATDAVQVGPLLVYTASFLLSVYEVGQTQAALKVRVGELGGFVASQTDSQLTLRIPSGKFEDALRAVEQAGNVRARNVQALDVGDQYRDVQLRLHTAELLRERLEVMLARAEKVPDALAVQAELERIVREIEQLKGQLRAMNDRIAYSTLVVEFRPESRPDLDDSEVFSLPFPWLEDLGLHQLLELSR